jgi:hypothetical protein
VGQKKLPMPTFLFFTSSFCGIPLPHVVLRKSLVGSR